MNINRLATTLLEVVIGIALFSIVMVAVFESMVTSANFSDYDITRDSIQGETVAFQNRVTNDFANSSWFFKYDPTTDTNVIDPLTGKKFPMYPTVSTDRSEITFLKLRTSMIVANSPKDEHYARVNFTNINTKPVDLSNYMDAEPTHVLVMNENYKSDPQWFVAAVWETNKKEGLSFDDNQNPNFLRHYRYAVEANKEGKKNLVRKYTNGYDSTGVLPPTSAWTLDEILFKDVTKVEFTTWLEDPTLNENQIRIAIDIERAPTGPRANSGAVISKRVDYTASMRSIYQD